MDWTTITAVAVPSVSALITVIWHTRNQISDIRGELSEMKGELKGNLLASREERITQIGDVKAEVKAYSDNNRRAVDLNNLGLQTQLQQFQLKVAEDYVRKGDMKEFESRIMTMLEKMDIKIDKYMEMQMNQRNSER